MGTDTDVRMLAELKFRAAVVSRGRDIEVRTAQL